MLGQSALLALWWFRLRICATVAQLVEQRIRNARVGGSSPPSSSKYTN